MKSILTNNSLLYQYHTKQNISLVFRFVLVCGHITFTSMENFLKDFLHEDRVSSDSFYDADVLIVDKYVDREEFCRKTYYDSI